jgi:hypothetical protein
MKFVVGILLALTALLPGVANGQAQSFRIEKVNMSTPGTITVLRN